MDNLAQVLLERNRNRPQAVAFQDANSHITYGNLEDRVLRMAQHLVDRGMRPRDRVVLACYDRIETVVMFLAIAWAGGTAVMVNPRASDVNLAHQLDFTAPRFVITEPTIMERISLLCMRPVYHWMELSDLAAGTAVSVAPVANTGCFMLFTSGTTGHSKAVLHDHRSALAHAQHISAELPMTEGSRIYITAKLVFALGMARSLLAPMWHGGTVLLDHEPSAPFRVRRLLKEFQPDLFGTAPVIYAQLAARYPVGAMHSLCISAGDRLPEAVIQRWEADTGQHIYNVFGTSEHLEITFNHEGGTAMGPVLGRYDWRLVDEDGDPVTPGQVGRLQLRGPGTAVCYYGDPEWSALTFGDWSYTSDLCWADGNVLHHVGRWGDVIKISGRFINPGEIEEVLQSHPAVEQAAVISRADDDGIEHVEAHVVLAPDAQASEQDLREWMLSRVDKHACPSPILLVDNLPRTDTGKVQRHVLRGNPLTH